MGNFRRFIFLKFDLLYDFSDDSLTFRFTESLRDRIDHDDIFFYTL